MSKTLRKIPKRAQMHPKGPQKASKTNDATRDTRNALKEQAQDPHGAQEANQASKVSNSQRKTDGFKKKHQIP